MYTPSKPDKYGIQLVLIDDNSSKYMLGGIPYLEKQGTRPRNGITLGHQFAKDLTTPYHHTNRNVTTDNWFTSVPLATDLLINCGMTHVGTVRVIKKEIPLEMKDTTTRRPGSSAFLYTNFTLILQRHIKDQEEIGTSHVDNAHSSNYNAESETSDNKFL